MLEPNDRTLFLEALRPPEGYELDFAVGTSYSLDLVALLTAPLAFTFFDWEDRDGQLTQDPLVLLETLRKNSRRMTLFCQTGRIVVPPQHKPLFGYLEDCVVEARAPDPQGAFHPKVWALRYASNGEPVIYRLVCLSRNLTFDRSWDTVVVLEGELKIRKRAFTVNQPIGDFFQALPGMAVRAVGEKVSGRLGQIQDEIRRVQFAPPEGFESCAFWPFGIGEPQNAPIYQRNRRHLIISPFLSTAFLQGFVDKHWGEDILVSRRDELDSVPPEVLEHFGDRVYYLATEADDVVDSEGTDEEETAPGVFQGLHAKLYVVDDGWDARLLTGSANATRAAFASNVELLVELKGRKSKCGVEAILGQAGSQTSLRSLLVPYRPPDEPPKPDENRRITQAMEDLRRKIANLELRLDVRNGAAEGSWAVALFSDSEGLAAADESCEVRCWLLSLPDEASAHVNLGAVPMAVFVGVSWQALTSFVVFSVAAKGHDDIAPIAFVRNLPIEGGPADRQEHLLQQVLTDRATLVRFLMMLLAQDDYDLTLVQDLVVSTGLPGSDTLPLGEGLALLEPLVQALARSPEKLDRVKRLVDDLSQSEAGLNLLPERFLEVWEPLWKARQERTNG